MDKQSRITYRMPEVFRANFQKMLDENNGSDAVVLFKILDKFFNPPEPEVVIKEVVIDSEGTVQGHSVSLSDALFAELSKIKYNPDTSMDSFVGDILWNRIQWSQNKKSPATTQKNGTTQQPQTPNVQNGNYDKFQEYMKRKIDPDMNEDDWNKVKEEFEADSELNEFQKQKLRRPIGR